MTSPAFNNYYAHFTFLSLTSNNIVTPCSTGESSRDIIREVLREHYQEEGVAAAAQHKDSRVSCSFAKLLS